MTEDVGGGYCPDEGVSAPRVVGVIGGDGVAEDLAADVITFFFSFLQAKKKHKKMKKKLLFIALAVCICGIQGCSSDIDELRDPSQLSQKNDFAEQETILGDKLNDPYDIRFMQQAYELMQSEGWEFPFHQLTPTGKYIRVLLNSKNENVILYDTSIIWSNVPLDYEILQDGNNNYCNDQVSGYTLTEIQNIVLNSTNYSSLQSTLFSPSNILHYTTISQLGAVLAPYSNLGF